MPTIRHAVCALVVSACASSQGGGGGPAVERSRQPPNVVLFLIDDMGWTDLGCQGSDLYRTPNIDRIAAQGIRFRQAYSACTVCSPTRAALMTGKYPARLHVTDWIPGHKRPRAKLKVPDWSMHLPLEETTIAEVLKRAGYATAHIGKWHLGERAFWPEKQGFDVNLGGEHRGQPPSYFSPYGFSTLADGPAGEYLTDRAAEEAVRFVRAQRGRPFFLYLPHYAVHTPLQAKADLVAEYQARVKPEGRHRNAKYAAMIDSLDQAVGRVLAVLDELGLAQNTLVVFTSDNGGLMSSTVNAPLRVGKGSAYEGGVRVPLLARWPGVIPAGSLSDEPVVTMDLFSTLVEATSAPLPAELRSGLDGRSLLPVLRDPATRLEPRDLFWHYPHYHPGGATPYSSIRSGDLRLIEFFEDGRLELYDLATDVGESRNLAASRPRDADALHRKLAAWRTTVGAQLPTPNPDYDPNGAPVAGR